MLNEYLLINVDENTKILNDSEYQKEIKQIAERFRLEGLEYASSNDKEFFFECADLG